MVHQGAQQLAAHLDALDAALGAIGLSRHGVCHSLIQKALDIN
jgi:hypothetical protein